MNTIVIEYDKRNKIAKGLIDLLVKMSDVIVREDYDILSPIEMKQIEKSEKSGRVPISKIKEKLKK